MSGRTVADFIAYWEDEGLTYARHGDYDWMASLVPGSRVLEIGCGLGFATQALVARGLSVMAIDTLPECLALTRQRVGDAVTLLQADVEALDEAQRATIERFAPDCVVCWLMGAPAELTGATASDGGQAVVDEVVRLASPGQHPLDRQFGVLRPLPERTAKQIVEDQLDRSARYRLAIA